MAPAIYRIKGSDWGWYKLDQLLEGVNEIRDDQHLSKLEKEEFLENFISLAEHPQKGRGVLEVQDVLLSRKQILTVESELRFLSNIFVPSGWGLHVLAVVRAGVVRTGTREVSDTGGSYANTTKVCFGVRHDGGTISPVVIEAYK